MAEDDAGDVMLMFRVRKGSGSLTGFANFANVLALSSVSAQPESAGRATSDPAELLIEVL